MPFLEVLLQSSHESSPQSLSHSRWEQLVETSWVSILSSYLFTFHVQNYNVLFILSTCKYIMQYDKILRETLWFKQYDIKTKSSS
jgi:hypothetical protein